jgi:hypothetical protein
MGDDDCPSLEQCAAVMGTLHESSVAQLFFEYNPAVPDYPGELFQAHPGLPTLSELEAKLLAGGYERPRQFCDEVVAVLDIFVAALTDAPDHGTRGWACCAEAVKSMFLKRIWKCTQAAEQQQREHMRSLMANPLGGCFERTGTMPIPESLPSNGFPRKINPRRYY